MSKVRNGIFAVLILTITLVACHRKNFIDNLNRCTYYDSSIDYDIRLYPFELDSIDFNIANKSIFKGIEIDTLSVINHENDTDYILKIHDSISDINFYRFNIQKQSSTYSLFEYSTTSNLIKYNNEIKIGMKRKEFFKNIGIPVSHCDSFLLRGKSFYYYFFIFESNKLKRIERKMPIM